MLSTAQFDAFFQSWHSLQPQTAAPATAMAGFFEAWHRLPTRQTPQPPTLDTRRFADFAAAFPDAHARHLRSGIRANVWRSAGIGQDEKRNCAVLQWLLDRFGDHGQGPDLLVAVLEHLQRPDLAGLAKQAPYRTRVEHLLSEAGDSRVDITIEGTDFTVLIEAKVDAPETGDQLQRYHRHLGGLPDQHLHALIFLTPDGRPPRDVALHGDIRPLSWAALAGVIAAHVARHPGLAYQPAGLLLNQFADHIRGLGRKRRKQR